jgi:uncharacterized protein (DUF488 family)
MCWHDDSGCESWEISHANGAKSPLAHSYWGTYPIIKWEHSEVKLIYTLGHSTRTIEEFVRVLHAHGIQFVVDVRTIAKSRHNPQFGEDQLAPSLAETRIGYQRFESLGGLRHTRKDSINGAWKNSSFRGYADYMQTPEFSAGIEELIELGAAETTAIMCAEAVPWRCHRSLIGDALLARGIQVLDIMSETVAKPHTLTAFAHVDGVSVTYPPEAIDTAEESTDPKPRKQKRSEK